MPSDQYVEDLLHHAREAAKAAADARAQLSYLEHFRRHLLAKLMLEAEQAGASSVAKQERDALASDEYKRHLQGMEAARVESAVKDWHLEEAKHRIDLYRTREASRRAELKAL